MTKKQEELLIMANKTQGLIITKNPGQVIDYLNDLQLFDAKVIGFEGLDEGNYYLGSFVYIFEEDEFLKHILKNHGLIYRGGTNSAEL